MAVIFADLSSI